MNKIVNLQDIFLNLVRKEKTIVVIYLTNGFQIKGTIKGFDSFIVIIETEGKQQLIYKHAISTIAPTKNVNLNLEKTSEQE